MLNLPVEMEGYLHPFTSDTSCDSQAKEQQATTLCQLQRCVHYNGTVHIKLVHIFSLRSSSSQREESSTEDDLTNVYK